jgi:hypothetical protein
MEETPFDLTVCPILEISVGVKQSPSTAGVGSGGFFKYLLYARLVVVERIRDECFSTDPLQCLGQRFKLRVVERDPLALRVVTGSISKLQKFSIEDTSVDRSESLAGNLRDKLPLETAISSHRRAR